MKSLLTSILFFASTCVAVATAEGLRALAIVRLYKGDVSPSGEKAHRPNGVNVAVLEFESNEPSNPVIGKQISEVLAIRLLDAGIRLVDREHMELVARPALAAAIGGVTPDEKVILGKIAPAHIVVTGKVFRFENEIIIAAKLVGTETKLVDGVLIRGNLDANILELTLKLSDKIASRLRTVGHKLVIQDDDFEDALAQLEKQLIGRKLPRLAIRNGEFDHVGARRGGMRSAAESQLRSIFSTAGFKFITDESKQVIENEQNEPFVVVSIEASSEYASHVAQLLNCSARVQVRMSTSDTGEILFSDTENTRAIDFAEFLAAETAQKNAARALSIRILKYFSVTLPQSTDTAKP